MNTIESLSNSAMNTNNTGSASSTSTTGAHAFVQRAQKAAEYILLINHCNTCEVGCRRKGCILTKQILAHIDQCNEKKCRYSGCESTRQLMAHIEVCHVYRSSMFGPKHSSTSTSYCLMCSLIAKKKKQTSSSSLNNNSTTHPWSATHSDMINIVQNKKPFFQISSLAASNSAIQPSPSNSTHKKRCLSESDAFFESKSETPVGMLEGITEGELDDDHVEVEHRLEVGDDGFGEDGLDDSVHFVMPLLPKRYRSQTIN